MSDRYAATIQFPHWAMSIPEIQKAVLNTFGAESDWKRYYDFENNDGILYFLDDQARYGEFEYLEPCLQEHNIPYDRWSDSYAEFDSEYVCWRPEIKNTVYYSGDGRFLINSDMIQDILTNKNLTTVEQIKGALQKLLPPEIKDLDEYKDMPAT